MRCVIKGLHCHFILIPRVLAVFFGSSVFAVNPAGMGFLCVYSVVIKLKVCLVFADHVDCLRTGHAKMIVMHIGIFHQPLTSLGLALR